MALKPPLVYQKPDFRGSISQKLPVARGFLFRSFNLVWLVERISMGTVTAAATSTHSSKPFSSWDFTYLLHSMRAPELEKSLKKFQSLANSTHNFKLYFPTWFPFSWNTLVVVSQLQSLRTSQWANCNPVHLKPGRCIVAQNIALQKEAASNSDEI